MGQGIIIRAATRRKPETRFNGQITPVNIFGEVPNTKKKGASKGPGSEVTLGPCSIALFDACMEGWF